MKRILTALTAVALAPFYAVGAACHAPELSFDELYKLIKRPVKQAVAQVATEYGLDPIKYRNREYFYEPETWKELHPELFGPKTAASEQLLQDRVKAAFKTTWKEDAFDKKLAGLKRDIELTVARFLIEKDLFSILKSCNCLDVIRRTTCAVLIARKIMQKIPNKSCPLNLVALAPGRLLQEYLILHILSDHGYKNLHLYAIDYGYPTNDADDEGSYKKIFDYLQNKLPHVTLHTYKNPYDYIRFIKKHPLAKSNIFYMIDPDLTVQEPTPFPAEANLFGIVPRRYPETPRYIYGPLILISFKNDLPQQLYVHKAAYDSDPNVRQELDLIRERMLTQAEFKNWLMSKFNQDDRRFDLLKYSDPHLTFQDLIKETAPDDALIFLYYRHSTLDEDSFARVSFAQVNKNEYVEQDVFGPNVGLWLLKDGIKPTDENGMIVDLPNPEMPHAPIYAPHYARVDLDRGTLLLWDDVKSGRAEE